MSRAHIEETMIGVFALTDEGRVVEKALYPKEAEKIARAITRRFCACRDMISLIGALARQA